MDVHLLYISTGDTGEETLLGVFATPKLARAGAEDHSCDAPLGPWWSFARDDDETPDRRAFRNGDERDDMYRTEAHPVRT